jgi:hypothetical protein
MSREQYCASTVITVVVCLRQSDGRWNSRGNWGEGGVIQLSLQNFLLPLVYCKFPQGASSLEQALVSGTPGNHAR